MDWFTSDTQFSRNSIIDYGNRPFLDVEEMNQQLIHNINSVVGPKDRLFHLGNFAFDKTYELRMQIECENIVLIEGFLDRRMDAAKRLFSSIHQLLDMQLTVAGNRQHIVMCHYPLEYWPRKNDGAWHLHGHMLGKMPSNNSTLRMDVGVDCHRYKPISIYEISAFMFKKTGFQENSSVEKP